MKNCLNENTLQLLHDGEGSPEERAHLESCLNCARRYRQLADDIDDLISVLKQPPPPIARKAPVYSGLRWSLAAAAVMGAFLLGRMTTAGAFNSHLHARSSDQLAKQQVADAGVGPTYGLYIENLIGQEDDADANQVAVGDTWNSDGL